VSKAIRYDSLLVRDLALELHASLAAAPLHAVRFDRDASALVLRAGERTWHWSLHPTRGELTCTDAVEVEGNVLLPRRARIAGVQSIPDERILEIVITGEDRAAHGGVARRLLVELLTNQWNALALAEGDRIAHVLRPRTRGTRALEAGAVYVPPPPTSRVGADVPVTRDEWLALLGAAEPGMRVRAFVRAIAYASPLNAPYVVGAAEARDDALPAAHARYLAVVAGARQPCVLPAPHAGQPYGFALDEQARRFDTLIDAFGAAVGPLPAGSQDAARAAALEHAQLQAAHASRRAQRLSAQLERAPGEAAELRRSADLLLAQLHRVRKGTIRARLDDFAGGSVDVELDPLRSPAENAAQLYAQGRKRERAARRLPQLIAAAERAAARWRALQDRIASGAASDEEIAAAQPPPAQRDRRGRRDAALPYRVFRTTGGLEVRVGRGARGNDALTLRHSAGNDFWLHARDVAGAHVILRWTDREANPPQSELMEAATLAALHSRARTSRLVPVDYTRRKYVRKPRRSPPGRVVFERGKTLFVEPDAEVEERMRVVEED
jgi:predicted ribosome quality control (RQC) complex YloA/Tae2 family protein